PPSVPGDLHRIARAGHGEAKHVEAGADVADRAGGVAEGAFAPHNPAKARRSASTPVAVTAGPAPGPVITRGESAYRSDVITNWFAPPRSCPSGWVRGISRSPTVTRVGVMLAT